MDRDPRGPRAESLGGRSAVVYRRPTYTTALAQRRAELAGGGGGDVYLHPEVLFFLGRRGGRTRGASPAPARTTHGARDAFLPTRDFERSTARGRREEDWDGGVRGAAPSPATARKGVARCRRRAQDSRARRAETSWSARARHRDPPPDDGNSAQRQALPALAHPLRTGSRAGSHRPTRARSAPHRPAPPIPLVGTGVRRAVLGAVELSQRSRRPSSLWSARKT